jgi:hypothetical protein
MALTQAYRFWYKRAGSTDACPVCTLSSCSAACKRSSDVTGKMTGCSSTPSSASTANSCWRKSTSELLRSNCCGDCCCCGVGAALSLSPSFVGVLLSATYVHGKGLVTLLLLDLLPLDVLDEGRRLHEITAALSDWEETAPDARQTHQVNTVRRQSCIMHGTANAFGIDLALDLSSYCLA